MARPSRRVQFPGGNGHRLAGIIDEAAATELDATSSQSDAAPVAIFSHCFTCNKDLKAIVRISRAMAAAGVTVLRYDMTGLGGSEGDFSRTNFDSNVRDLRSAIQFAMSDLGHVDGLIGHSLGGAATLFVAGTPNLEGIDDWKPDVCVTLAAPSDTVHLAELLVHMNGEIESVGFGDVNIGGRVWTIRREMIDRLRQGGLPDKISRVECPTLIFHSPNDRTVSFDHALRIEGLIRQNGTAASLLTLDGADHLLVRQPRDLTYVAKTATAFIRRYSV